MELVAILSGSLQFVEGGGGGGGGGGGDDCSRCIQNAVAIL